MFARTPAARAGFYFTLAALWRNKAHRLTVAGAVAVGLAMVLVDAVALECEPGAGRRRGCSRSSRCCTGRCWSDSGTRSGCRRSCAPIGRTQLAWRGHARSFAAGVEWAAILTLVVPAVLIVMPLVAIVAGGMPACVHALLGLAGAVILLEVLMLNYDKVPFLCSYVPGENGKATVPLMVIAFLVGASLFARLELAVVSGANVTIGIAVLAVMLIALRCCPPRVRAIAEIDFNEGPATIYHWPQYSSGFELQAEQEKGRNLSARPFQNVV